MPEFLGEGRTYEKGRSTEGWRKGPRLTSLTQAPVGTLLWCVSHAFESENLAIVTDYRPAGVYAVWANTNGAPTGERDVFTVWQNLLEPVCWDVDEYFLAERVVLDPAQLEPAVLIIEMLYEDFDIHGGQETPYFMRGFRYGTRAEAERDLALLTEEVSRMDPWLQKLIKISVENPEPAPASDMVEALREIAGFDIRHRDVDEIRSDSYYSYWHQFTDEDLERYKEKGMERA